MNWYKKASIDRDRIEQAGYQVFEVYGNGTYYSVQNPKNEEGVLVKQSDNIWHFFWNDFEGSASGNSPETAMNGGLGDVIGTDEELAVYKELMMNAPDKLLATSDGLYRCSSDVYNEPKTDDEPGDNLSDAEADAMTLRDAGMGTDEDYGKFQE